MESCNLLTSTQNIPELEGSCTTNKKNPVSVLTLKLVVGRYYTFYVHKELFVPVLEELSGKSGTRTPCPKAM